MRLVVAERTLKLRRPLLTSYGALSERVLFDVTLIRDYVPDGHGEAAPLESYDGVPDAAVRAALSVYAEVLESLDHDDGPAVLEACRSAADLPQALAAIDLALWDSASRAAGVPVARLISDDSLDAVVCNALVQSPEDALDAVARGFDCLKVKVGLDDDVERVGAIRAVVGPNVALRVDANGAWDVDDAVAAVGALARFDLEFVEEPVSGIDELRAVRGHVAVPIAMDETTAVPGAIASGATDFACLKISAAGGISGLLAQASLAQAMGTQVFVASTFDGPVGIAAAAHCAAALRCEPASGLGTLGAFAEFGPSGPSIGVTDIGLTPLLRT